MGSLLACSSLDLGVKTWAVAVMAAARGSQTEKMGILRRLRLLGSSNSHHHMRHHGHWVQYRPKSLYRPKIKQAIVMSWRPLRNAKIAQRSATRQMAPSPVPYPVKAGWLDSHWM